jgi:hypothetical protein
MNLIDESIVEKLSRWAELNEDKNVFPTINEDEDSYYINRNSNQTYIMEYSFKTLQEVKESLNKFSGLSDNDSEILKIITVEMCQERFKGKIEESGVDMGKVKDYGNKKSVLPEFVYVF